ncbi:MAG: hypothetical protein ACR2OE_04030 [Thermomicrobiales bacterium]
MNRSLSQRCVSMVASALVIIWLVITYHHWRAELAMLERHCFVISKDQPVGIRQCRSHLDHARKHFRAFAYDMVSLFDDLISLGFLSFH